MKTITPEIVVGYLQCRRKGFLLLVGKETGKPHAIEEIIKSNQDKWTQEYLVSLKRDKRKLSQFTSERFQLGQDLLVNAKLTAKDLETSCTVLIKSANATSHNAPVYEPTFISGHHSVQPRDRTNLLFAGHVLAQLQSKSPKYGFVVIGGSTSQRVKLENNYKPLLKAVSALREWRDTESTVPHVILNKHCNACQFRLQCQEIAEKQDDLSLLDRMTPKAINRYHKKGIFTVQQLSYLFRSRRSRKTRATAPVRFNPELQALAIRTGKIIIHEFPKLSRKTPELFLDIEGIPDQEFYYLFGLLVLDGGRKTYHAFWADDRGSEKAAWTKLSEKICEFPSAPIYHYGHYEARAVEHLQKRHSIESSSFKERLENANSLVFGKIYFPVRSNGLKDLAQFLGVKWTEPDASGLQSLVWRSRWEQSRHAREKERLITYNQEDCTALLSLVENLARIDEIGSDSVKFDFTDRPNRDSTEVGTQIHNHFERILISAQVGYDKNKISIRRSRLAGPVEERKRGAKKGHQAYNRMTPTKFGKIIYFEHERRCPRHKRELLVKSEKASQKIKIITDLVFTKSGCKKVITKYIANVSYCRRSGEEFLPSGFVELGHAAFGHAFRAWAIYQRVVLRLPYQAIIQTMEDLFREKTTQSTLLNFVRSFSIYYEPTEKMNTQLLLASPFIHADETQFNIEGSNHYVWVFTDGKRVIFKITESRESTIVHEFLRDYQGVLVSDFYPGYDSVNCRQQKCWVHLIRDLNEDLWKSPFNTEFESFVVEVRKLIGPIFDAVDKYGLKKRNLRKFRKNVEDFYEKHIIDKDYQFEFTVKYQKRFSKYKEKLFTFLDNDSIPWNNNTAERASRHLAVQRKISGTLYKNSAPHYLVLLGIAQTCRFQNKSFLKFLLSKEKDVDLFRMGRPLKFSVAVTPAAENIAKATL